MLCQVRELSDLNHRKDCEYSKESVSSPLGAFFVKIIELRILSRVEVALKDNTPGQTHVESYPEIDSGLLRADQYFWFKPSSRWDEDYTVTVTSRSRGV